MTNIFRPKVLDVLEHRRRQETCPDPWQGLEEVRLEIRRVGLELQLELDNRPPTPRNFLLLPVVYRELSLAKRAVAKVILLNKLPRQAGIYCLKLDRYPVYIGQTVDLQTRLMNHIVNPSTKFDSAHWSVIEKQHLDLCEALLIDRHRPIANAMLDLSALHPLKDFSRLF